MVLNRKTLDRTDLNVAVSYSSVLDLSVSARQKILYEKAGLNIERWTEMGEQAVPGCCITAILTEFIRPALSRLSSPPFNVLSI